MSHFLGTENEGIIGFSVFIFSYFPVFPHGFRFNFEASFCPTVKNFDRNIKHFVFFPKFVFIGIVILIPLSGFCERLNKFWKIFDWYL